MKSNPSFDSTNSWHFFSNSHVMYLLWVIAFLYTLVVVIVSGGVRHSNAGFKLPSQETMHMNPSTAVALHFRCSTGTTRGGFYCEVTTWEKLCICYRY